MNKNLMILLSGQLVSQIGDKFYMLALAFWVLKSTGSSAQMGIVLFCSIFPATLLGFFSGAFIDKFNKKTIIVSTDIIRGIVISGVAFLYAFGVLNLSIIIIAQVLLSINAAFFDPAIPAIIPDLVDETELTKANSQTQFISGFATIIGPVLGGLAVSSLGYLFVFSFNAASYLISGLFECFIEFTNQKNKKKEDSSTIWSDIKEGWIYVAGYRKLLILLLIVGLIHFFVGSIEVVIPMLAVQLPGNGAQNLGYLQTSFGVGMVCMALLISFVNINNKEEPLLFAAVTMIGLSLCLNSFLIYGKTRTVFEFVPLFVMLSSFIILAATCFRTLIQKLTDKQILGRVFGLVGSIGNLSIPVGMLLYGFVLEFTRLDVTLLYTGFSVCIISIFSYLVFIRNPKEVLKK